MFSHEASTAEWLYTAIESLAKLDQCRDIVEYYTSKTDSDKHTGDGRV